MESDDLTAHAKPSTLKEVHLLRQRRGLGFAGLLAFALTIAAIFPAFSQQSNSQTPEIQSDQHSENGLGNHTQNEKEVTGQVHAILPDLITGNPKEESKNNFSGEEKGREFWPPVSGYRLKVTDTILAAFTFGVFIATLMLYYATRNLVRGAEKAARMELRAYVGIENASMHKARIGEWPEARITITNFGKTPAYKFRYWIEADLMHSKFRFKRGSFKESAKVLNPGHHQIVRSIFDYPVTDADITGIKDGTAPAFCYGVIRYIDAFGRSRRVDFRLEYGGEKIFGTDQMIVSKKGNYAN